MKVVGLVVDASMSGHPVRQKSQTQDEPLLHIVDGAISDTEQSWKYTESNTCCFETSLFVQKVLQTANPLDTDVMLRNALTFVE
jgi:hypothetical protein